MQQYTEIKSRYPGIILFFRLGDFYEMFGDDAIKSSKILEVTLTRRQNVPMCGIPYHAANAYLKKLIKAGEKVAVCEQLEEPGQGRGIVRRDVVRVITPGTILEDTLLESKQNNFLIAVCPNSQFSLFGIACADISTGEFSASEIPSEKLLGEIYRLSPVEILAPKNFHKNNVFASIEKQTSIAVSPLDDWSFTLSEAEGKIQRAFGTASLKPFGLDNKPLAASACGAILSYFENTQKNTQTPFSGIKYYSLENHLILDEAAIKNLELIEGSGTRTTQGSLLEAIDSTLTPAGGRLLRQWLLMPVLSVAEIKRRQEAVHFFVDDGMRRRELRAHLNNIADLERIVTRLSSGAATPREVIGLKISLETLPQIKEIISSSPDLIDLPKPISGLSLKLDCPGGIVALIRNAVTDEPPATLKDGGIIRDGFSTELDELRQISRGGKKLISDMESREKERTGITSLKIGYTSVFGYFIEVTKSNLTLVPADYIRKQTVASGERFITQELKSFEEKVLSADEKIIRLEEELFKKLRVDIYAYSQTLKTISTALSELDVYASFAQAAAQQHFVRPEINDGFIIDIKDGRHPVVENRIKSGSFVPNDTFLDGNSDHLVILTGPNMAGKSTYLRQAALTVILAQIGSFVPASSATVGIVDRIFTRIGAADNLAGGQSTFMVEMNETANILHQFGPRSLIILDEVGRGTSTYDGISIARAVVEYLAKENTGLPKPKVLFATHYFELTGLAGEIAGIKNFNVAVKEWQGEVVFLHKIISGAADRSYGIHVAQLAGIPKEVIVRAKDILYKLEENAPSQTKTPRLQQPDLFSSSFDFSQILIQLNSINIDTLTPLEALQLLAELKGKAKEVNYGRKA